MSKKIVRSLLVAIASVLALGLRADPEPMFYIGSTGYDCWTNVYKAASVGDTIVVGTNAAIDPPASAGVIGKSLTIDLNGQTLNIVECWLTGCSVAVVDTGMPSVTGRFEMASGSMNMSGGTLDLSALSGSQVDGKFQMSSTSLLKFPGDMDLDQCTTRIVIDSADQQTPKGKGARIVVKGVTYVYDGTGWGIAFKITSISVHDEAVEFGVMVPADGEVTILGSETVDGNYVALTTTKIGDGVYQVPVSTCRFFKASMEM